MNRTFPSVQVERLAPQLRYQKLDLGFGFNLASNARQSAKKLNNCLAVKLTFEKLYTTFSSRGCSFFKAGLPPFPIRDGVVSKFAAIFIPRPCSFSAIASRI